MRVDGRSGDGAARGEVRSTVLVRNIGSGIARRPSSACLRQITRHSCRPRATSSGGAVRAGRSRELGAPARAGASSSSCASIATASPGRCAPSLRDTTGEGRPICGRKRRRGASGRAAVRPGGVTGDPVHRPLCRCSSPGARRGRSGARWTRRRRAWRPERTSRRSSRAQSCGRGRARGRSCACSRRGRAGAGPPAVARARRSHGGGRSRVAAGAASRPAERIGRLDQAGRRGRASCPLVDRRLALARVVHVFRDGALVRRIAPSSERRDADAHRSLRRLRADPQPEAVGSSARGCSS